MYIYLTDELMEEFLDWLDEEHDYRPKTLESHRTGYLMTQKHMEGQPFTLQACKAVLKTLKKHCKPNTRSSTAYTIRMLSRCLSELYPSFVDFSDDIPHIKREQPIIEVLTNDEITQILTCPREYRRHGMKQFWFLCLSLLARTGRRVSEINSLKVKDIDFGQSIILIRDPKNKRPQWIPIPLDLCELLQAFCQNDREYVFPGLKPGKPITVQAIRKELYIRRDIVGLRKNPNPHKFRHSFPTELLRQRVPLPLVSDLLGHANWETTRIYTHLLLDDLINAANFHRLNQHNLPAEEIVKGIKKDMEKYQYGERKDIKIETIEKQRFFEMRVYW